MRARLGVLALLSLTLVGCGSGSSSTSGTSTAPAPPEKTTLTVYFLRDARVAAAHVRVARTTAIAHAALAALLAGPPPGLQTALPGGAHDFDVSIDGGRADVHLGSGADLNRAARAQIVYTLTRFPTIDRVSVDDAPPATRADFEDQTPIILVETPAPGDTVKSPIHVAGTSNTFEATLQLRLVQNGKKLYEHFVTATSGTGQRGTFTWDIPTDATGPATLEAFEYSAENGSEIHKVEIPIMLS